MRCLFVSDLHYSLPQFDWLLRAANKYDLVILAGDALDVGSIVDFRAQTLVVCKYLQRLAGITRLVFCSGNHDLDSRTEAGEKVARWIEDIRKLNVACDDDCFVIEDTLFSIYPWWDGPMVRDRLIAQLDAELTSQGRSALGVGASRAGPRFADKLVGQAISGRQRPFAMDRPIQPQHGRIRSYPPVAFCDGRLLGRFDWRDMGV